MRGLRDAVDECLLCRVRDHRPGAREPGRRRANEVDPGRAGAEGIHATVGAGEPVTSRPDGASDRELVTTRVLDAPRERVFTAFSEAQHLMQWWGPDGFTNTFHEFDLRAGGPWRYTMHGPNGA